jgi:hypothetical protein
MLKATPCQPHCIYISKILSAEYLSRQKWEMEKYLSLANEDTTDTLEMKFDKVILCQQTTPNTRWNFPR